MAAWVSLRKKMFEIGANDERRVFAEFEFHSRIEGINLDNSAQRFCRNGRYGKVGDLA
jgi:hypothetical protein